MPATSAPKSLLNRFRHYSPGTLAGNTVRGTFWHFARLGCQIISIFVIAHTMGPDGYGILTGLGGLAIILGSLSGLGGSMLLLQYVARYPERFSHYWHATLRVLLQSSTALAFFFIAIAPWALNNPTTYTTLVAIALSELIFYPLLYVCSFAFHAHERLGWATALPAGMALFRLIGALIFWAGNYSSLDIYCLFHLAASGLATLLALIITTRTLKPDRLHSSYTFTEIRQGFSFSTSNMTNISYGEIDKLLTIRLLGASAAGTYTMAYRIIHALALPVFTLLQAAQPRLLSHIQTGNQQQLNQLIRMTLLATAAYMPIAIALLAFAEHLIVALLGTAFIATAHALLMMIPLLPLFSLRLLAGTLLSSAGKPGLKAMLEIFALGFLVIFCSILIPMYGMSGTAISVMISELFLLIGLSLAARQALGTSFKQADND